MTDYGHELEFGTFITPAADRPSHVLELASLTEQTGLDLVTVQDHPYQPRHLDTWTLLSTIAAQTSTVRVAPNVANLPLRPPVVLARSVATLDVLSGGRAELGLGSGAFWDAIAAAGGPRLTLAQAVDALAEAIEVIRGSWHIAGGAIQHDGGQYQVNGAQPGPAPAHDVQIWLGAYKPRMLRLTAAAADGWLPSLGYADPGELPALNAALDEAARAAGRAPAQIRRLYNVYGRFGNRTGFLAGQPGDWAEQLAELTLTQGMSTYLLGTDSPEDVRRFAAEVAPAVRELVATERSRRQEHSRPQDEARETVTSGARTSPLGVRATPEDGVRYSAETPWDEGVRPTGPAPDPEREFTAEQQADAQHLVDMHDGLRGELEQLRDIIEQVAAGTQSVGAARSLINRMTLRQNNWTLGAYCAAYCRAVTGHHALEDQRIFPHLAESDSELAPVLKRLEEEHHTIADVIEQVDRALVATVSDADGLSRLRSAVDLLTDTMRSHLAYEERELLEPLARFSFY